MAITTVDSLIAALPGQNRPFFRVFTPQAPAAYTSLWLNTVAPGQPGGAVAASSGVAGDVPTSGTAGAIPFTNPAGGVTSYLVGLDPYATTAGVLYLYDRLWQNSGLSPTTTGAQTVQASTPVVPLTRPDALGANVEAWFDVQTVMGASTPGATTITYTNQSGTAGQVGTVQGLVTGAAAGRSFRISLASGDTGVRSIQSYNAAASLTSGTFSLVLRRRIAYAPVPGANAGALLDAIALGLPQIYDSACLELLWLPNSGSALQAGGLLSIGQG